MDKTAVRILGPRHALYGSRLTLIVDGGLSFDVHSDRGVTVIEVDPGRHHLVLAVPF
jgi:hypothetical protein